MEFVPCCVLEQLIAFGLEEGRSLCDAHPGVNRGPPTGFEEVSLASGPHGLGGTRQGLLTELWSWTEPWCGCSPSGDLITPGLGMDFFRIDIDT